MRRLQDNIRQNRDLQPKPDLIPPRLAGGALKISALL